MTLADELRPCPFCGGEAGILCWTSNFQATCKQCLTTGKIYKSSEDAIAAWNTRIKALESRAEMDRKMGLEIMARGGGKAFCDGKRGEQLDEARYDALAKHAHIIPKEKPNEQ